MHRSTARSVRPYILSNAARKSKKHATQAVVQGFSVSAHPLINVSVKTAGQVEIVSGIFIFREKKKTLR